MPIVSHVKFGIPTVAAVPERVVALWAENLKARAPEIYQRLLKAIPDETEFFKVIADLASRKWSPFVAADFVSEGDQDRADIVASQAVNLRRAYPQWSKDLAEAFKTVDGIPAKHFKERVDLHQAEFVKGLAERVLPFTGLVSEGRGPAPKAGLWLTGNDVVHRLIGSSDEILEGGPYRVCAKKKKAGLKAMLVQRLIKAGNNIIKASYDPAKMTVENQLTCEQVQGFVDPALDLIPFTAGGDSKVDYILGENQQLYLEIKVSKM